MLETALVWAFGPHSALALAPQVSAPTPFDVFHDLRWLLVYHQSWLGLLAELLVLVALRGAFSALIVDECWPHGLDRPDFTTRLRRSARFSGLLTLLMLPWATLLFAMAAFSLSWLFIAAVPAFVLVAASVHHGVVTPRWWRDAPPRAGVLAIGCSFVVLTVVGGLLAVCPAFLRVPLAAGAGVANAWCWLRIVDAVVTRPARERKRPFALVAIGAVTALVVGGTLLGFVVVTSLETARAQPPEVSPTATGPPVLVVKGFNSRWDGRTLRYFSGGFRIRRFSYRGTDGRGVPRPYERAHTHRSIPALALEMAEQVQGLHEESGEPVAIVAESEGALVAKAYLAAHHEAPVETLVMLSPLLEPGRVYYPRLGDQGWGMLGGVVLDGMARALGQLTPVDVTSDTPLFRSIVDHAPAIRGLLHCPLPGVRQLAVLPLDSGLSAPGPADLQIPYTVRPSIHGGLLGDGRTKELVEAMVTGRRVSTSGFWRFAEQVVQAGASPWQVPDLGREVNGAWDGVPDRSQCRAIRAHMRAWLP